MATIEDYICEQLAKPLKLKDGSTVVNDEGKAVTKEEGIAMNLVNQALQGGHQGGGVLSTREVDLRAKSI